MDINKIKSWVENNFNITDPKIQYFPNSRFIHVNDKPFGIYDETKDVFYRYGSKVDLDKRKENVS